MDYLSISALNKYLKYKIDNDTNLNEVYLKGEISNLKFHQKGIFLTLKDEYSSIQAMITNKPMLENILKDGQKVLVKGKISVYVPYGSYRILVEDISLDGLGELYLRLEALKKKLSSEGLFDFKRKEIKKFPKKIAVITSKTGAVIEDIRNTVLNRYPLTKIVLYSANVQGNDARPELIKRLMEVNNSDCDCLIIGRGGGSIEDLWAFNEEDVVRAISSIKIPVITAIGHETDTTLADYVADKRASTPTQAAMLATPDRVEIINHINNLENRINNAINNYFLKLENKIDGYKKIIEIHNPKNSIKNYIDNYNSLLIRLNNCKKSKINVFELKLEMLNKRLNLISINEKINEYNNIIEELKNNLRKNIKWIYEKNNDKLKSNISKLIAINPLGLLQRGYSVVKINDKIVKSVNDVKVHDTVDLVVSDGVIKAEVL